MARIRTIKPEFPHSESMGRVSRDARLLFILMFTLADDTGRTRASSRMLASLLFPYDEDAIEKVPGWLSELQRENCVQIYEISGHSYLQITNWSSHQKVDHPTTSKFPGPPVNAKKRAKSKPKSREDVASINGEPREDVAKPRENFSTPRETFGEDQGSRIKEGTKDLVPLPNGSGCDAPSEPEVAGVVPAQPEPPVAEKPPKPVDPWAAIYARGKIVLGQHSGGTITTLRKLYDDKPRKVLAKIEDAAEQREPARWLYAFLHAVDHKGKLAGVYIGGVPP